MIYKLIIFKGALSISISLALLVACQSYYKTTTPTDGAANIDSLNRQNRYFVLRSGTNAFHMRDLSLSSDHKTLEATLVTLAPEHRLHLESGINGRMRYRKTEEYLPVLSEVHLYIEPGSTVEAGQRITLPLEQVLRIEVIEKDKKRTTNSYVLGAVGFTVGAFVLVAIIVAATKSSCPFVSAYDGSEFSLQGEIYGGAIYPQLARYDYLPLKMAPMQDGTLQLKISNELQERQYTDMTELWVVTHPRHSKLMVDERGNLFSVSQPLPPVAAWLNNKKEVTAQIRDAADNALLYMDDTTSADATNEVVMKFRTRGAESGKLILTLKNSYWLDLLYGELAKGFGSYYSTYIKQQQNRPASELLKWTKEQHIPLEVSVKDKSGWKKVTDITTMGPLATRQMVIAIDRIEPADEYTEVKLSSGFMFWEIDYAAMDFSDDTEWNLQKLQPVQAIDEEGKDVLLKLQNEDGSYLEQPQIGNIATITFKGASIPGPEQTQSYFLKTKGYYEHIRDFKNKPDIGFLQQFKKPGAFPKYGMVLYKKVSGKSLKDLAQTN